jgi:hypothetical protein
VLNGFEGTLLVQAARPLSHSYMISKYLLSVLSAYVLSCYKRIPQTEKFITNRRVGTCSAV